MLDREPNKASEKYLEEKFEKSLSLAILVCKKGKLTSLAVQNPCCHPQVLAEHPFSDLRGPL